MAEGNDPGLSTQYSKQRTDLSVERTARSYERTLMAWTRTAASLISFGFTIYKFFESYGEKGDARHLLGSANFALVMISIGLGSLLLATLQHWRDMRDLPNGRGLRGRYLTPAVAGLVSGLGFLGLFAVIFRQ